MRVDRGITSLLSLPLLTHLVASGASPLCRAESAMLSALRGMSFLDLGHASHDCHAWDAIISLSCLTRLHTAASLPAEYRMREPRTPPLLNLQHLALRSETQTGSSEVLLLVRLLLPLGALVHLSMAEVDVCAEAPDVAQATLLVITSLLDSRRLNAVLIQPWRSEIIDLTQ